MRKPKAVAAVVPGRVGAHSTRVRPLFSVLASEAEAARPADAGCLADARPRSTSARASVASP